MEWYEDEVKRLEKEKQAYGYTPETVFFGSSSIRLWSSLSADFNNYKPANLGFGGSTLAACTWFFDRVMAGLKPKRIIIYAGDNDLGDGRHPEEVYIFFRQMVAEMRNTFGDLPAAYISVKPSITRWGINDNIKYNNELIEKEIKQHGNWHFIDVYHSMTDASGYPRRELYQPDGLHLSKIGYELWKAAVLNYLENM